MMANAVPSGSGDASLDAVHHLAISVDDIGKAVDWYTTQFRCRISYQDATWALLDFSNMKLALVIPSQHPPHLAFESPEAEKFGVLKPHRDGTRSVYVTDPAGNSIEVMAKD